MKKENEIKLLITLLKCITDKKRKEELFQNYILENGPIPNKYKNMIEDALK